VASGQANTQPVRDNDGAERTGRVHPSGFLRPFI
jgi:hypothetical protein